MKILLTGKPKSGKTTLLKVIIGGVRHKHGFVTEQILRNGERYGFELVSEQGIKAELASVNSASDIKVSKYGVNIASLNDFLAQLPKVESNELIYIDEIGQMELYSEKFKSLVGAYLNLNNPYIGTITNVYEDYFVKQVLSRKDIIVIEVNENCRTIISEAIKGYVKNFDMICSLDETRTAKVIEMANTYASTGNYIQLKKLFCNAVVYLADNRITSPENGKYIVHGKHEDHLVEVNEGTYKCDCKFFNGLDEYTGKAGECSHVQAIKLTFDN